MTGQTSLSKSALLIIDVQQSFLHMPYWSSGHEAPFQQALLKLEAGCRAADVPVVHIFHIDDDAPFRADSGLIRAMDWLPGEPAARFDKHVHNAFTDTGLDHWLRRQGVQRLLISGIRTEQCCETTARVGSDLGYAVDFVSEAARDFRRVWGRWNDTLQTTVQFGRSTSISIVALTRPAPVTCT